MHIRLQLLLLCITVFSLSSGFSQNKVEGKVIDKNSKEAIPRAIIKYGTSKKEITHSDKQGMFSMPDFKERIVHIECKGYENDVILLSTLKKHPVIELNVAPIELSPIEISADAGLRLLEKVYANTKAKMLINKPVTYLARYTESEEKYEEKRDFYFEYIARQDKREMKKDKISFNLWLKNIKHIERLPDEPQSKVLTKKIRSEFHLREFPNSVDDNRYVTISETNDSLIKLTAIPKPDSKAVSQIIYYINTGDSTLHSVYTESIDSLVLNSNRSKRLLIDYKLLRVSAYIKFEKKDNQCYFANATYTYTYSFMVKGHEEIISAYLKTEAIRFDEPVNGYEQIKATTNGLYKKQDTTDKEFWLRE